MERILVCTDGSPNAGKAIDETMKLQEKFACEVILCSVYTDEVSEFLSTQQKAYQALGTHDVKDKQTEITRGTHMIRTLLSKRQSRFAYPEKVTIQTPVGEVVKEVLGVANRERVDLIVLGTAGHKGLRKALLGSSSESIVKKASCSVLIVR